MHIDDRHLFPSYSVFVLQCSRPCCLENTKFGQLILRKNNKIVATRCQFLRPKCTKVDFGWGSTPDSAGVLTAFPRLPMYLRGLLLTGGRGKEKGREWEGRERGGRGRERGREWEWREMDSNPLPAQCGILATPLSAAWLFGILECVGIKYTNKT